MEKEQLLALIADDDLGLLNAKPKPSGITSDERLVASFAEINDFVTKHGCLPEANSKDIHEHKLFSRLNSLLADSAKANALREYDEFGLLASAKQISSLNDIFADDDLGILSNDAESIFTLRNIPKEAATPEYIARRKPCKNFAEFEPIFKQCHAELKDKKRVLRPFIRDYEMEKGNFFVLKGMLVYIAHVGEKTKDRHGKWDARLRAIFENGTESDLLLRSLGKELFKDGRRVTELSEMALNNFNNITTEDQETGYIYVLKSLSEKPEIKSIEHLYKIGFSRAPVEERIKNATQEPTYLNAPVKIVSAYKCYNLNPQKFEQLLHTFFGKACLNMDLYDNTGKRYAPREWFVAPLEIIEMAASMLINGDIVDYVYDVDKLEIVGK